VTLPFLMEKSLAVSCVNDLLHGAQWAGILLYRARFVVSYRFGEKGCEALSGAVQGNSPRRDGRWR
jgi:hypothetical protein